MIDTLRVAIVADLLEEGWPSMDLVADMLMAHAGAAAPATTAVLFRPDFGSAPAPMLRRIAHRFWSYPLWLRRQPPAGIYHIVDHSYAHLALHLPAGRVVVTCHDTDAFRTLIAPGARESGLPRWFVRRVLHGLRRAAMVVCDSDATREDLVRHGLVPRARTTVVPIGVHPCCTPAADAASDSAAAALVGAPGPMDLLHVGSTIPRKRIDLLLEMLALVARAHPSVTLWRVGGAFTPAQEALARNLGVHDRIKVLPFVERPVLAALYRRAALTLLPSDREGFGLPIVEAMACGTPILCSDLPVLREVGADGAAYCPAGNAPAWAERIASLMRERETMPPLWAARRARGLARAADFSWDAYAAAMRNIYRDAAAAVTR